MNQTRMRAFGRFSRSSADLRRRPATIAAVATCSILTSAAVVASVTGVTPADALNGIDVSSHQHPADGPIDWNSVAASGQKFASIKATEGTGYINPFFASDTKKAKAAGLTVGSYHFARPDIDAKAQARFYATQLALQPQPSLPPTLDIEVSGGLSPAELQQWTRDFVDEIKRLTGRTTIIYTYYNFWLNNMGNTTEFSDYPLWLAYYSDSLPSPLPGGWDHVTFWQHTDSGSVSGINTVVDMSKYYGDDVALQALSRDIDAGTPVGGVATAIAPIVDTEVAEADVANAVQHELENNPDATVKQVGKAVNVPVSTPLLVSVLGVAAGAVSLASLWNSAKSEGYSSQITDLIVGLISRQSQNGELPLAQLAELANGDRTVVLGELVKVLTAGAGSSGPIAQTAGSAAAAAASAAQNDGAAAPAADAGIEAQARAAAINAARDAIATDPRTAEAIAVAQRASEVAAAVDAQ